MKRINLEKLSRWQKIALCVALAVLLVLTGVIMWQTRENGLDVLPYEISRTVFFDAKVGAINELSARDYEEFKKQDGTFLILAHNTSCPAGMPLTSMVKDFAHEHDIAIYGLMQEEFRASSLSTAIKFLPSLAILHNGEVVAYLDAESDADLSAYRSVEGLETWLKQYIKW